MLIPVMTSSGHSFDHATNTEKMQRLPGKLLYRDFFIDLISILILIILCRDFVIFLKGQILRELQILKYSKFSEKSMTLKKECIARFPKTGSIRA